MVPTEEAKRRTEDVLSFNKACFVIRFPKLSRSSARVPRTLFLLALITQEGRHDTRAL